MPKTLPQCGVTSPVSPCSFLWVTSDLGTDADNCLETHTASDWSISHSTDPWLAQKYLTHSPSISLHGPSCQVRPKQVLPSEILYGHLMRNIMSSFSLDIFHNLSLCVFKAFYRWYFAYCRRLTFIRVDKSSNVSIVQCYFAFTIGFDSGLLEINIHIIKKKVRDWRHFVPHMFIKIYKAYIQGIYTRLSIKISLAFLEINIHIINKGQELTSICSGYVYQESTKLTYNVHGAPGGQGSRHSPGWSRTCPTLGGRGKC